MSQPTGMKYVLAIDLGTSGPKVGIISIHGKVVDSAFEKIETLLIPQGGAEQDPDEWWSAIKRASRRLLEKGSVPEKDIMAVSSTSQWSGTVAVDAEGNPLMNAIIWMDSRGSPYVQEMTGGESAIVFDTLPSDDPVRRKPDISRAVKLLGWEPTVSLKEGLERTIDYFRELKESFDRDGMPDN